jgi:hypothetical protein
MVKDDRQLQDESHAASFPGTQAAGSKTWIETAMDEALEMSFPASDPPAWGCLLSAVIGAEHAGRTAKK